jgi:hypothetical protein
LQECPDTLSRRYVLVQDASTHEFDDAADSSKSLMPMLRRVGNPVQIQADDCMYWVRNDETFFFENGTNEAYLLKLGMPTLNGWECTGWWATRASIPSCARLLTYMRA